MKLPSLIFILVLALSGCTGGPKTNNVAGTDTSANAASPAGEVPRELCFQRLQGTANQDTTVVKLIIDGDQVSGDLAHYPFEKDSRVGTIRGSKEGAMIRGTWIYMQEGVTDSLAIEFRLERNKLIQRSYTVNRQSGREEFGNASLFNIEFTEVPCN